MEIAPQRVVTLHYTLKDDDGKILDESKDGSFSYLHGTNSIIPGLENALLGKTRGHSMSVSVSPEEGYGVRDENRIQQVPRTMFPEDAEIKQGMQFHSQGPDGELVVVSIAKIEDDTITVDGNHPLAGVGLNFDVEIIEIRDATSEELDHGHAHGPNGNAHD